LNPIGLFWIHINYIREVYPRPWDKSAQKLVAFLFGIASHMVSDVSWHSLNIDQGFLKAMGEVCIYKSGDVLSRYELNFDYLEAEWYIPVKDLFNIYKLYYGKTIIEESTITHFECILFCFKLYPTLHSTYASKSPFLVERFQEYFLGGIDDMAYWSTNIFQLTSFMLDNGTSECYLPENPIFIQCNTERREKNINAMDAMNMKGIFAGQYPNHITSPSTSYFVSSPYARLGWAMTTADLNGDGHDDLVVGAPGYSTLGHVQIGRVYIVYGTESGLPLAEIDLDKHANGLLEGFENSGRFGSSLAVLDFNLDGHLDLAVGAPSVGSQVHVFGNSPSPAFTYCNLGWTLLAADMNKDRKKDLVIGAPYAPGGGKQRGLVAAFFSCSSRKGSLSAEESDWSVSGEHDYAWFGYSLHTYAVRNHTLLLVGSPTWSTCKSFILFGVLSIPLVTPPSFEQSKLGSSFASGVISLNKRRKRILLIGTPTKIAILSRQLHHAGTASVYELKSRSAPSPLSTLSGDRAYARFGAKIHLDDLDKDGLDEIIVTSPLRNDGTLTMLGAEAGRVYIYNGNARTPGYLTENCKSWVSPCPEDWAQYVLISPEVSVKHISSFPPE
uniref:Sodium/potassium-transporting ATPase subunit beta-1-interacting protein 3 n=1 Tax=Xenopus tropicalis TaxID=8364 RepID=L7N2J7_XENTR